MMGKDIKQIIDRASTWIQHKCCYEPWSAATPPLHLGPWYGCRWTWHTILASSRVGEGGSLLCRAPQSPKGPAASDISGSYAAPLRWKTKSFDAASQKSSHSSIGLYSHCWNEKINTRAYHLFLLPLVKQL